MKLALSALLVLAFTQLSTAVTITLSDPVQIPTDLSIELYDPNPFMPGHFICYTTPGCSTECQFLVASDQSNIATVLASGCAVVTPFAAPEDSETLDHLRIPGVSEDVPCVFVQNTRDGRRFHCALNLDTTTTTATTTTATTTTVTTTTTATVTTTTAAAAPTCSDKDAIFGKKKGNGYNGDCCKTQADCKEECIKGKCNGPKKNTAKPVTTATTTKKTTTAKPTQTSSVCKSGYRGKKKGNGPKGACCITQRDCKKDCVKGQCN